MTASSEQAPGTGGRPSAPEGRLAEGARGSAQGGPDAQSSDAQPSDAQPSDAQPSDAQPSEDLPRRHQRLGWTALTLFVAAGMGLEALHAFKIGAYLDVDQTTRRFMWTLSHAHGTLLALVNLALAASLQRVHLPARRAALVSQLLMGATVLVPGGFFLGGLQFAGGDPGVGVLLVPIGGLLLVSALGLMAWATR